MKSRYTFYLARSYADSGQLRKAMEWYKKRLDYDFWVEEKFWCAYQVAGLKMHFKYKLDEVMAGFMQAHELAPWRAEPLYAAAAILPGKRSESCCLICTQNRPHPCKCHLPGPCLSQRKYIPLRHLTS